MTITPAERQWLDNLWRQALYDAEGQSFGASLDAYLDEMRRQRDADHSPPPCKS